MDSAMLQGYFSMLYKLICAILLLDPQMKYLHGGPSARPTTP